MKKLKRIVSSIFSLKGAMFLGGVYLSTFFIDILRRKTKLGEYEEKARESVNMDGGFLSNIF